MVSWKSEQGYGFVENPNGGGDLFLHINDIKGKRVPEKGDSVSYQLHEAKPGRWQTTNARLLKLSVGSLLGWLLTALVAMAPFVLSLASMGRSVGPFYLYAGMSVLCFLIYRDDKHRAESGRWRIPDNSIYFVQLFYGWPGGVVAQKFYRHKARKKSFQGVFRFVLFVHLMGWIDYLGLDHLIFKTFIQWLTWVADS